MEEKEKNEWEYLDLWEKRKKEKKRKSKEKKLMSSRASLKRVK